MSAARTAFADWSALAVSKRGEILGRASHRVEQDLDELIPLLTKEQGNTLREARIEIAKAIDTLMHYVGLSEALRGAHTPNLDPGVDGIVLRRPLGVVAAIVPWNFPTFNCGQACLAIKRVYVFESVADQVIEQITAKVKRLKVGRGNAEGSQMGALHTASQRDEVAGQVQPTLAMGGSLTAASQFGLGSSVWTRDLHRARQAAEQIEAGYTWINSRTKVYDELPFGGWKSSGYGKEQGEEAFGYYTESKSVEFGGLT